MDYFSPKQREFLERATHRWNIKEGATRSGKTYLDYFVIPRRIRKLKGKDGLIVILGNTKGTLQRNIITPMQNIWGTGLVSDIKSDNTAILFGERCYCLGADKVSQVDALRGSSIKYCYGDEVVTWHQDVFEMLKSRLDKGYSCFDGACNPDRPTHWFKTFLDNREADIYCQNYQIWDNPFIDKEVVRNMEKEFAGTVYYDRYILGKWVLAEGLIYQMFSREKNTYSGELPDGLQAECARFIACDYGTANPTTFLDILVTPAGEIRLDNAYYYDSRSQRNGGRQKTDEEYYQDLAKFVKKRVVRRIQGQELSTQILEPECVIVDPAAASFIECIRRHGEFLVRQAENDVLDGIRKTSVLINTQRLLVNERCTDVLKEFESYAWDTKGEIDKPIKEHDHAMDALRYFVNTIYSRRWGIQ